MMILRSNISLSTVQVHSKEGFYSVHFRRTGTSTDSQVHNTHRPPRTRIHTTIYIQKVSNKATTNQLHVFRPSATKMEKTAGVTKAVQKKLP